MRTENDLRRAIRERADRAPTTRPDLLVVRPSERHVRRGARIAIVAAAVTVAAVAAAPLLLRDDHSSSTTAQPASASSAKPPGARTTPVPTLLADRTWISYSGSDAVDHFGTVQAQYIELRSGGNALNIREITAFAPGLFSKSLISDPQPVTVNGRPGFFGAVLPWRNDNVSHTDPAYTDPRGSKYSRPLPSVAWKIGANQWVAVTSDAPSEGNATALIAIASRVHATSAAVRTPIKIGYLPSGYQLSDVDHEAAGDEYPASFSEVGFRRNTKYDYPDWTVSVTKPITETGPGTPVVGPARPIYSEVHRTVGEYVVTVATQGTISKAQAERVLASVTLAKQPASPNDTWFTLAQALP
jgi:hypothetical protein